MAPGAGQAAMRLLLLFSSWKALQGLIGSCPTLTTSPYLGEASPFGWPLSPNAWSFVKQQEWGERYLMCEGHRQSPMDIATHGSCVKSGGEDGLLQSAFAYSAIGRETVQVSSYMRSAAVKGDFGSLHLQDAEGRPQQYTAHEAHLSADSWHSMDGQSRVAELMIFHKPKDHPDMLKGGVVVSIFFEQNESAESELFSYMGFPKGPEELEAAEGQWTAQKELLDLPALLQEVTSGPSYMYEGSVPVPPCSETVKYLVLGKALHVHPRQIEKLKDALGCFAGGYKKRLPVANHLWDCRDVFKNSLKVPGPHHGKSCEEFRRAGTWSRVSDCWDVGADDHATCVKSPIDLVASKAGDWREKDWESDVGFALGSAQSVTVDASKYTLDAMPSSKGVRASIPNFGSIKVQGRSFLMHKISVKAVSSHSYEGKRHVGEIQVECIMEGDGLRKLSSAVQGTHTEHRLSQEPEPDTQDYHRVILSFPLELGDENVFLDQLGLPVPKYRNAIAHGNEYTVDHVDVKTLLQKGGSWFWYRGGLAVPGCPEWGVRWLLYEKPMTASLAQLNFLDLEVSGMDSTRLEGPQMDAATYKAMVGLQSMPRMAVDKHTACSGEEWNYADPSCWAEQFPLCRNGQRQSPIDVKRSTVLGSGKDNFLAACSWRPVENMHVVNFGKGLAVPGKQLGYITMTGEDGFPQFFEVAQIQLKMPSEHFIDSQGFGAELQIVHRNQQTVTQGINSADSFPFVTTSFFFEIGDKESTLLRQLFLPGILEADTYRVIPQPLDLMRHLGPALDGDFYTYEGSSTSPDCHELNKWFIFEHAFSMSLDQFESFKAMFPSPGNNRPLQPLRSHRLAKNSFEDGTPNHYDFYLGRHEARNRLRPGEFFIVVPIAATLVLMCAIMSSILVRDWAATKKSISGMAEMIGKSSGNRA